MPKGSVVSSLSNTDNHIRNPNTNIIKILLWGVYGLAHLRAKRAVMQICVLARIRAKGARLVKGFFLILSIE